MSSELCILRNEYFSIANIFLLEEIKYLYICIYY
jgi:hypothetical protein